jgi:hypothetical protein
MPASSSPYNCPSCRATVRDTKHNATVSTLLEMFLAANPEKGKTAEEKDGMREKYKPGDEVLPKFEAREKTLRERRVEDEDRRLMDEVRDLSLREVGVETAEARRERRRREHGRSHGPRPHSSQDDSRHGRSAEDRERRHRRAEDPERRRAHDDISFRPDVGSGNDHRRRRSDEGSRRGHEERNRTAARQIEHQSSLRSLISSSDIDSHEMEEEILRQIQEEGLLDGIDLENIDVNQEDQISERIAEAFRRRQSDRARLDPARTSQTSGRQRQSRTPALDSRETSGDDAVRTTHRRRTHSRSPSAVSNGDEPSRPPPSLSAARASHLDVQSGNETRPRRRTTSSSRSVTAPVPVAEMEARPAARSQTDLSNRPQSTHLIASRPLVTETSRSNTDPSVQRAAELPASDEASREQPVPRSSPRVRPASEHFPRESQPLSSSTSRIRATQRPEESPGLAATSTPTPRAAAPAEIFVPSSALSAATQSTVDRTLFPAPLSPHGASLSDRAGALSSGSRPTSSSSVASRSRPQLYPEPSLTCARCAKAHIEYELHYNCKICSSGNYNICLACYRQGLGCLHWFGFGYAAFKKWEMLSLSGHLGPESESPHMLTPSRYIPPRSAPGGADGRKTLTTDDPQKRLQSGAFCANCLAWANECYWRCDRCNEGDWGFCNLCVNQGESCTHPLLPLTYKPSESYDPPLSPTQDQQIPPSATILVGPGVVDIGSFKPLTFSTKCDICHYPIQPSTTRYHCFSCVSKVPNTQRGDYDICTTCYTKLESSRRISAENGKDGWRRCLQGHRMVIVGFEDNHAGQRRVVVQDLVGGRGLHEEPRKSVDHTGGDLQKWSWEPDKKHPDGKYTKLVTVDVMKTAPTTVPGMVIETSFPADGGVGMSALALWSWPYALKPELADDELLFPKGSEIRECMVTNEEWYSGTYMGKKGLFPAPYVKILDKGVRV